MHSPPMNVATMTPNETADEPMIKCTVWNQTIS